MCGPQYREPDILVPMLGNLRQTQKSADRVPLIRDLIKNPNAVNRLSNILQTGSQADRIFAVRTLYEIYQVAKKDAQDPSNKDRAAALEAVAQSVKAPLIRALWDHSSPDVSLDKFTGLKSLNQVKGDVIYHLIEIGGQDSIRAVTTYFDNATTHPFIRQFTASTIESKLNYAKYKPDSIPPAERNLIRDWAQRIANTHNLPDPDSNQMITHMIGDPDIRKVLFPLESVVPKKAE